MSKNFNSNTDDHDEWLTPPYIIEALGAFDLDPCAPITPPWRTAKHQYNVTHDGLTQPWFGRVWCNPPYGRETFKWLDKLAAHAGGGIALIFARTETKGFHRTVWQKAHSVFFFEGRLKFYYVTGVEGGTANAPSCLVAYTAADSAAVAEAARKGLIKGQLIYREFPK